MALYEEFEPQPNRLITAQSAYLRSAAYQPIGWYEYGPEAFEKARRQQKPVFLDIGAVWCHWCHVMDRESYEDPEIATFLNELYIPIKVDRDERPDIDSRYQTAVQLLTGQGGWPLTVFLTPDGQPFYGGTYFPPEDRYGRVGMKTLLPKLAETYKHRRHELTETARVLTERTRHAGAGVVESRPLTEDAYRQITEDIRKRFNAEHGGFEHGGPKFPHSSTIELALAQWERSGDETWRTIIEKTLTEMGRGGIYDQLGGGFHRYSTDATWSVPHFEKMGYDNALLLTNYLHAYRAFDNAFFREIAEGTLDFMLRELTDQRRGGFYSTQDADFSMNDDGGYWTWSFEEFTQALTPEEATALGRYYGIRRRGDMPETGRNVLRVTESPLQIAEKFELSVEDVEQRITSGKQKLLALRNRRKKPRIDASKYANWNGLMISAFLEAGIYLDRADATAFALRTVETILNNAYEPDHGIYHRFHADDGAELPGFFEDQVFMAQALLDAFAVSGKPEHLETARHLLDLCITQYWDDEHDGFLDVARDRMEIASAEFLRQPRKVIDDMPTPASNAVAALLYDRLWLLMHEVRYHDIARRTLETFATHAPDYGPFAATFGLAVYYHLVPPPMVAIIGGIEDEQTQELQQAALSIYRPGRMVAVFPPGAEALPYPADEEGRPVAYVCAGETCAEPTRDLRRLQRIVQSSGKSAPGE